MKHAPPPLGLPEDPRSAPGARLLLAYSGGVDSSVLLDLLAQHRWIGVQVLHVHHGLQVAADDWAQHCERVCAGYDLPCRVLRVQVADRGQGLEAAARLARYAALQACMRAGDVLVTAHHRDDQAETLLLRLLRGSGPEGLAGMRGLRACGPGWLWRPLLAHTRVQIRDYAQTRGLRWIEDPHNADARYARSLLRAQVMPTLAAHWPAASANLARAAALQAETADCLRALAAADLAQMADDPTGASLPIAPLRALGPARSHNLLRHWLRARGLPLPFHDTLQRLPAELFDAAADAVPVLAWPGAELRRYRERLYAMRPLAPLPPDFDADWDGRTPLQLPADCGRLESDAVFDAVRVRLVQAGEHFRPPGAAHRRSLKNLFQERGIPVWVRARTPAAVAADGQLLWIGGLGAADRTPAFAAGLRWIDAPPGAGCAPLGSPPGAG